VAESKDVDIDVSNMPSGRIAVVYRETFEPQRINMSTFDGVTLSSGTYFIHIVGEAFRSTRQVLLIQ